MAKSNVRIGGASGFWGDSSVGPVQLVEKGNIDYLVFDYLAELTMSILAAAKMKDPTAGYAKDFVDVAMRQVLKDVVANGIKVISNAGGINPHSCAKALEELAAGLNLEVKVAVVEGDDIIAEMERLKADPEAILEGNASDPVHLMTANAYLGACPILRALENGAQIVITGRCVDSAVTLAPLMYEFGWRADDFNRLAAGSLAGHIIECGCQSTGGLHTDWEDVPDWANIGYPIVDVLPNGTFFVEKPAGTGGLVSKFTVAEQLLYEIGDPANYYLPDVICNFQNVSIEAAGENRVVVSGATGRSPTNYYKISATYLDGYRASAELVLVGIDADVKAVRTGKALLERTSALIAGESLNPYSSTNLEVLGAETLYGPHSRISTNREVVLRLTVTHKSKAALGIFAREIAAAGTSFAPGTTGAYGRPSISPVLRQYAFQVRKSAIQPTIHIGGASINVSIPSTEASSPVVPMELPPDPPLLDSDMSAYVVSLVNLAYGRSGDKGDTSNIGLIARKPEFLPVIRSQVTVERVSEYLSHLIIGPITRYDVPGVDAVNFVCEQALNGGGTASLRADPLGKGMAQILLDLPVRVPARLVTTLDRS